MGTNLIKYIQDINNSFYENSKKEVDNSVTELHMHKILFFLYGGYYKKFRHELFNANFQAWKLGPVEANYRKNKNNSKELNKLFPIDLQEKTKEQKDQKEYVNFTIKKLLKISAWTLVDASHLTNVWKNAFNTGKRNALIKNADIQKEFIRSINI